jgi:type III secretory pathway component EscV
MARSKRFKAQVLLRPGLAIMAAWVVALIALAIGLPVPPVVVLALIVSARVFQLLGKTDNGTQEPEAGG